MSYEDLQEAPSGSEANLTDTKRAHPEHQSYRETVRGTRSYMKWSFMPDTNMFAPHTKTTLGQVKGLNLQERFLLLCQLITDSALR